MSIEICVNPSKTWSKIKFFSSVAVSARPSLVDCFIYFPLLISPHVFIPMPIQASSCQFPLFAFSIRHCVWWIKRTFVFVLFSLRDIRIIYFVSPIFMPLAFRNVCSKTKKTKMYKEKNRLKQTSPTLSSTQNCSDQWFACVLVCGCKRTKKWHFNTQPFLLEDLFSWNLIFFSRQKYTHFNVFSDFSPHLMRLHSV